MQHKWVDAEVLLRECLVLCAKREPNQWATVTIQSMLGEALTGRGQYAAAEELLLASYHGLEQQHGQLSEGGRIVRSKVIERLARLYDAWDKKDEADKWRTVLKETQPPTEKKGKP